MLNSIKLIGVVFLSLLLLTNCKKDVEQNQSLQQGELVFTSIDVSMDKSDDVPCGDLVATHAKVVINGKIYLPQLFELNGNTYTQAIKLDAKAQPYTLEEFSLVDEFGVIIKTTPMKGSEYAEFVQNPLTRDFYIRALETEEMAIEVLCFYPDDYELFGFEFFEISELSIRKQHFSGTICINNPKEYWYSEYGDPGEVLVIEKAIFKIRFFRNEIFIKEYYHADKHNLIKPLTVAYADYKDKIDKYRFELWIYVKVGKDFNYVKFHQWTIYDDDEIESGADGITDFVLGDCISSESDLYLSYIN